MEKIPCSVGILTLNAKTQLERLLPVIAPVFDDVYIMDGNSTDGTQEYARSLGVRVEKQFDTDEPNQRIKDFRSMRLRLWSKGRYDWRFLVDADEIPTPEVLELTHRIVAENDVKTAHTVLRLTQLPDGRVVKHALFYPYRYPNIFAHSSGVMLGERAVHERLVFPPDVKLVDHDEAILDPQPPAAEWRKRQMKYLALEAQSVAFTSWSHLFRWIIWYNLRSFFGQFAKAVRASIISLVRGETALPWSYNEIFLEYRLRSMWVNGKAWWGKRRRSS
ncbi:MAG TPA: hypothetical protein VN397_01220 [Candidatus Methylomirabilis sp.]|nr:hypothetical protein [Candidatus Methylomirabilis sp.]